MTESLYDVLGVEPSATESEIKNAWRSLVTVLGPTDHRFGSINEAASVLLDADKRAAYDASLGQSAPKPEVEPESPTSPQDTPAASGADDADESMSGADDATEPADEPANQADAPVEAVADAATAEPAPRLRSLTAALAAPRVAAITAVVAVAMIVATSLSYLLQDNGPAVSQRTISINLTDANVKPIKQQVSTRETADVTAALAAAVTAAPKILDYDYRTLDTWLQTATSYMTPTFAKTYTPYFTGMVKPNVTRVHGLVQLSPVLDAGVVSTESGVVEVLIIVDARVETTNQAVISQEFATLKMVKVDGRWLVDKFGTAPIPK